MNRLALTMIVAASVISTRVDAQVTLRLESVEAAKGEEVQVSVFMDAEESVRGFTFQVAHDPGVLTLHSIEPGADTSAVYFHTIDVEENLGGIVGYAVSLFSSGISGDGLEVAVFHYTVRCEPTADAATVTFSNDLDTLQPSVIHTSAGTILPDVSMGFGTVTVLEPAEPCFDPSLTTPCITPEVTTLLAAETKPGDQFGADVAASGDLVVVSAPLRSTDVGVGAAYLFSTSDGLADWTELTRFTPDATSAEQFGVSVALSGDRVLVGALGKPPTPFSAARPGKAYVFSRDAITEEWAQEAALLPESSPAGYSGWGFGSRVAMSGDVAVVADEIDGYQNTWVFERDAKGEWDETAWFEDMGGAIAIVGDRIVVGAWRDSDAGDESGAVDVISRDVGSGEWTIEDRLTASDGAAHDRFGFAVAMSETHIAVGAPSVEGPGAVYAFVRDTGTGEWIEEDRLAASDGGVSDALGVGVAISGDRIAAHASGEGVGLSSGRVYTFKYSSTEAAWLEEGKLAPSLGTGMAGPQIALADDRVFVGNPPDEVVYAFRVECGTADEFMRGDVSGNGTASPLGDAIFFLVWQFLGGPAPPCFDAADANDNGRIDSLVDPLFLLSWGFLLGTEPPSPGPFTCGPDPTADDVDCATEPSCP